MKQNADLDDGISQAYSTAQSLRGGVVSFALFTTAVQIQNCLK
jgi:hypothetical protein